jgi:hypothetical protein
MSMRGGARPPEAIPNSTRRFPHRQRTNATARNDIKDAGEDYIVRPVLCSLRPKETAATEVTVFFLPASPMNVL